jgi:hypothetical protein
MDAADVWKIVLGAVLALLVQWSSLTYQTRQHGGPTSNGQPSFSSATCS